MTSIRFNKKLGQHILVNTGVIDTIINKAKISKHNIILEVGGGTGNLTLKILPHCKKLICIEKDTKMAAELIKRVNIENLNHKFELTVADVLKIDLPIFDLCITNLPYQISSPFLFKLLTYEFKCAFIMFQKEFAERLVCRPGSSEWCRLSVTTQLLAKTNIILQVKRNSFFPVPKVDSSVVKIIRKERPNIDFKEFDNFLKICFLRKNKTLLAIFKGHRNYKNEKCISILEEAINEVGEERAAKMDVEDFLEIFLTFKKNGIKFEN